MLFLYPMYNRLSELLLVDVMLSVVDHRAVVHDSRYNTTFVRSWIDHFGQTNFGFANFATSIHVIARFWTTSVARFAELSLHLAPFRGRRALGHRTKSLLGSDFSVAFRWSWWYHGRDNAKSARSAHCI